MGRRAAAGDNETVRRFVNMTSAENLAAFTAMRALVIGHVFNNAEHGDIHHARHVHGLFNYHGNEILRRGNNNDACNRQGLEHRQGNIARSREACQQT